MNRINRILAVLIVVALGFAFQIAYQRHQIEQNYANYEFIMDYNAIYRLSIQTTVPMDEYIQDLSRGINVISLGEESISSLSTLDGNISSFVLGNDLHVKGDREYLQFIADNFNSRLKETRKIEFIADDEIKIEGKNSDLQFINMMGKSSSDTDEFAYVHKKSVLENVGLGFSQKKIDLIKNSGLDLVLVPSFNSNLDDVDKSITYFGQMFDMASPRKFLISDFMNLYEFDTCNCAEKFARWIEGNGISLVLVENWALDEIITKHGITKMKSMPNISKIRMFDTPLFIQKRYDYNIKSHHNGEEIANAYFRAISSRNNALVRVRPFIKDDVEITSSQDYVRVLNSLERRLEKIGFVNDKPRAMQIWHANMYWQFVIALGICAALLIVMNLLFGFNLYNVIIFALLAICAIVFYVLGKKTIFGNTLFNMVNVFSFCSLAMYFVLSMYNRFRVQKCTKPAKFGSSRGRIFVFIRAVGVFVVAISICMVGNFMQISLFASSDYMLEQIHFKGVKILQLVPILLSMLVFYIVVLKKKSVSIKAVITNLFGSVNRVLQANIKVLHMLIVFAAVLFVGVYILRSGNTLMRHFSAELWFRNMLEHVFVVRPRTKAILIGYPAIILLAYYADKYRSRKFALVLTVFMSIGFANVINTFSHLKTFLLISFLRVYSEIILSIGIAAMQIMIIDLLIRLYKNTQHHYTASSDV